MKDWIKTGIKKFSMEYKYFDDRNPEHVQEADKLTKEISEKLSLAGYDSLSARRLYHLTTQKASPFRAGMNAIIYH